MSEELKNTTEVKKKIKKKRRKQRPFLVLLIIILLIIGTIIFLKSRFFTVSSFEISGNSYYTESEVKELSGINTGKNLLFETNLKQARDKLLESPYISVANMSKKLPKTVVINVVERVEFAAVVMGQQYAIIDNEGRVLRIGDSYGTLPIIDGVEIKSAVPGSSMELTQSYILPKCINLLNSVEENDLFFERISVGSVSVKAYIYYDNFCCEGTLDNILELLPEIRETVLDLYNQDITHGTIIVGSNSYLVYQP